MIFELLEATDRLQEIGAILYVLYSIYRELQWIPVKTAGSWRAPTIIGAIALINLLRTGVFSAEPVDYALLAAAVAVAAVAGGLAGMIAKTRPLSDKNRQRLTMRRRRRRAGVPGPLPTPERRTPWAGAALWALAIAALYAIELLGENIHSTITTGAGLALIVVAVTEGARLAVFARRATTAVSDSS